MLPGARGGVAPYIMSAVKRKKACEELLHSFDPPASHSGDRLKVRVCVCVCVCMYVHTYTRTHARMYACMYVRTYARTHARMHVCMHVVI